MNRRIGVIGLGYVGLPMAVSFGKKQPVIGFDINETRIDELKNGYDRTGEVEAGDLDRANISYTTDLNELSKSDFMIVAVPTPINKNNQPDLTPLIKASETVGKALVNAPKETIVVFESTVYPGATEDDCVPVIEKFSGLKAGEDFFVGYSPERINPGDKENTFESIVKVVSGQTPEVLEIVAQVYESVVTVGVHRSSSIKVAEAAKVIENTQRDVNIALMNEIAIICGKAGIDTNEVLKAAGTKWNFLKFSPGLVGGHCIGVDPYYLTYKAQELGYHPEVILSGRRINDNMPKIIASDIVKKLLKNGIEIQRKSINFLGLTFKEDCPDLRNTKAVDLVYELKDYGLNVVVNDVEADKDEAKKFYNIDLKDKKDLEKTDALVIAVKHKDYIDNKQEYLDLISDNGIIFDIKGIVEESDLKENQKALEIIECKITLKDDYFEKKIVQITAIDMSMHTLITPLNLALLEDDYSVHIVCSDGKYIDQMKRSNMIFHEVKIDRRISPISNLKSILKMVKLFRSIRPDIVHVHTPVAAVLGRIAAKIANVPTIIYTAHGFYFHEGMSKKKYDFYFRIEKYIGRFFTDYIFTQSIEDHQVAKNNEFLKNKNNYIHISNGIDLENKFNYHLINKEKLKNIKEDYGISNNDFIVTFIGRLVKEKGILDLLNSLDYVESNNLKLLIVGGLPEGERDTDTYEVLEKYKNNSNVIFTGHIENVNELLYLSDVFCLPSYREGMPRSIIEAMSMKNAILATNIRGSREEVIHGQTGFLFETNEPKSIARYIDILNSDRNLLKNMQNESYKRVFELYDEKKVIQKQLEIFNVVTNKNNT